MSLIPGVGQQNVGAGSSDPSGPLTDADLAALLGGNVNGQFVTLPDGRYVLVNPRTGQIIQDFGARDPSGGSGNALGWAQLAQSQANQSASSANQQASLAETIRQFNEQMGYNKAQYNTNVSGHDALGNPTLEAQLGRGNLDVARGNLGVSQGRLGLDQAAQAFKQYTDLANIASNPRNYVQNFFMNRGQSAPPDVARYGSTNLNASQITPFSQFLGQFQSGAGASSPAPAPTSSPQGYNPTPGYGSAYEGLNSFNPTNNKVRLAPNDPDAAGLLAKNPSLYEMQSPENVMKYTPPKMYGKGGSLQMMVPHALVNLATGRVAAIAGERGPEKAYFDGAALIDPSLQNDAYDTAPPTTDPFYGTPNETGSSSNSPSSYQNVPFIGPTAPTDAPDQFVQQPGLPPAPSPAQTTQPLPITGTSGTQPFQLTPEQQQYIANQSAAAAAYNASQPNRQTSAPIPTSIFNTASLGPASGPAPSLTDVVTPGATGGPVSYGQPVPTQMPTYLSGENFAASNPITESVRNLPFMKRLYAQGRGDASQGTNTPQRSDLPPDLPLVSQLGWSQLAPSEQQALLSYVSSLGVTPEDYLNMIRQASPQGGQAYSPSFGNAAPYYRQ